MGFIKKLIGGIFAFLGGLLGGLLGKKSEYYVELDEKDVKPIEAAKSVASAVKAPEPTPAPEPVKVETKAATNGKVNGKVEAPAPVAVAAEPAPAPVAASSSDASSGDATFAPKFLTPTSTNGRRRPGPSLSPFLDMAKQVKS